MKILDVISLQNFSKKATVPVLNLAEDDPRGTLSVELENLYLIWRSFYQEMIMIQKALEKTTGEEIIKLNKLLRENSFKAGAVQALFLAAVMDEYDFWEQGIEPTQIKIKALRDIVRQEDNIYVALPKYISFQKEANIPIINKG